MSKETHDDAHTLLARALESELQPSVLVVGDVMLDRFIYCESTRCSPEEPSARVLVATHREEYLGGAANVAANAAALGARTTLVGMIGDDASGKRVGELASRLGISTALHLDPERPTTTKTRYILSGAHVMRHDDESLHPQSAEALLERIVSSLPTSPRVIYISDYLKGVITGDLVRLLRSHFPDALIVADGKPQNCSAYIGLDVFKVNTKEAADIVGILATDDDSAAEAALLMVERLRTTVIITRGKDGMTLCERHMMPRHITAPEVRLRDVTGAGDTTLAALGYMLAHGASLERATEAAALVAGIAVSKLGTAAPSREEIRAVLHGSLHIEE